VHRSPAQKVLPLTAPRATVGLPAPTVCQGLQVGAPAPSDLAEREVILKIVARLSNRNDWPGEEEMMNLRTRYSSIEKQDDAPQNRYLGLMIGAVLYWSF
jgi:hypothetical protein